MGCEYCQEDRDGYVRGLDKQGHYYIHNDELRLRRYGQKDEIKINFCPMCGRQLNSEYKRIRYNFKEKNAPDINVGGIE